MKKSWVRLRISGRWDVECVLDQSCVFMVVMLMRVNESDKLREKGREKSKEQERLEARNERRTRVTNKERAKARRGRSGATSAQ
jgi:hypothetical protein